MEYQVFLSNMNNFQVDLFGTLTGVTTSGQSGSESTGNEGVPLIPQSYRMWSLTIQCSLLSNLWLSFCVS